MRHHHGVTNLGLVSLFVFGCSAAEPGAVPESVPADVAESSGGETSAPVASPEVEPVAEVVAPAEPSGPASFQVRSTVAGRVVAAHVRVLSASGDVVAEGESGVALALASGSYRVAVQVTDAAVLLDRPTQTQDVTLAPGNNAALACDFPWAKVQLNVLVNGKSEAAAVVRLSRKGAVVGDMKSRGDFVAVSPGRYDAEVLVKGNTIKVEGILFPDGATQTVPVAVQL